MSKTLIIAEKPLIGQAINQALPGSGESRDGCIYNGNYIITWAFGHMLTLKEPEDYSEDYKHWSIEQLPIFFKNWEQKIGKDSVKKTGMISKAQKVKQIGNLLKEVDLVINAGDVDEEGQFLIDEILRWHKYKGPVKRLNTADLTEGALKRALQNMEDNKDWENEGWSAYARSVADLMMGINMSRYFSCLNNILLTVGRVQTPTLGLVVIRDNIIENHTKTVYYELYANLDIENKNIEVIYKLAKDDPNLTDGKILDKSILIEKEKNIQNKHYEKVVIKKKPRKENAPLPFNLVKLQSYCGKQWNYSPSDVMKITQSLRENHKAITYNRSDCQYLTDEHFKEAPKVIEAVASNLNLNKNNFNSQQKSKCFNNANVSAHHAIIPTAKTVELNKLTQAEKNVYLIICYYYLAQFLPAAIKEETTLLIELDNDESLNATSTIVKSKGYLELLEPKNDEKDHILSLFKEGIYDGDILNTEIKERETKPPARYTKSSLNEDMTRIAKYVKDPIIKELLLEKDKDKKGENGSIGTSATRSTIIDNLIKRGFLAEKGKVLISTTLGRELYRILPEEIKKPDLTAKWWVIQEDIRSGKADHTALTKDVLDTINNILKTSYPKINRDILPIGTKGGENKIIGKCLKCGGDIKSTPKGYFCVNKECTFALWPKMKYFDNQLNITETKAKALLKNEYVPFTLKSKSGKDYTGNLKITFNDKYVGFEMQPFEEMEPNIIGVCPKCGADVETRTKGYFCTNKNCNFILWKTTKYFNNTLKITDIKAKALLSGKHATFSLISRDNKKYNGYLKIKIAGDYVNFVPDGFPPFKTKE